MSAKEIKLIAKAYSEEMEQGRVCALATVVQVVGSSYRKPGAQMLIGQDGHILAGCVSGGCLEADVAEWAGRVIETGEPRLLRYDTLSDEGYETDLVFGAATGCRGIVEILVEAASDENITAVDERIRKREPVAIALVYKSSNPELVGRQIVVSSDESGHEIQDPIDHLLRDLAAQGLAERRSKNAVPRSEFGDIEALVEYIDLPIQLVLVGAGNESISLSRIANELGWSVTIVDHRGTGIDSARFPDGASIIHARIRDIPMKLQLDSRTALIALTHSYAADRDFLEMALSVDAFYIGVLGSHRRAQSLISELTESHEGLPCSFLTRLHAPVGLALEANTPETVALSIAAEIQTFESGNHKVGYETSDSEWARESGRSESLCLA